MIYKNDHMLNVYSNRYKTEWTNTDLRIRFGEIMFSAPGKHLVVEEKVGVTMTWLTVKELRDDLDMLVKKFEAANGELKDGIVISTDDDKQEDELTEVIEDESESSE